MQLVTTNGAGGYRWQLVRQLPAGADIVACGVRGYPDVEACHGAASRLADASGTIAVYTEDPGGWRWRVTDASGQALAESAVAYRSLAECQDALSAVRVDLPGSVLPERAG
jgi:uncharacterized protein YegP (UPF0339 family)